MLIGTSSGLFYAQMRFSFCLMAFLATISPASSFSDDPVAADYVERGGHSGN
jgi:hypothetical protein